MVDITRRDSTVNQIYRAYESAEATQSPREYLGASILGRECDRFLWLEFRNAIKRELPGRLLRLFDRGHREEPRVVRDLESIGCQVETIDRNTGEQFREHAVDGHLSGGMDGAVLGLPEAPKTWHVLEVKTHNDDSFRELTKHGVEKAKPEHWSQMQLYMRWTRMERALYFAVNKNDDSIYTERVHYDAKAAEQLEQRGERIVFAPHPPERLSERPDWYACKMCPAHGLCHERKMPLVNCRTCVHSSPARGGKARWTCAKHNTDIPRDGQLKGCPDHAYHPGMLPRDWKQVDANPDANWIEYELDGVRLKNGTAAPGVVPSVELQHVSGAAAWMNEALAAGAKFVEPVNPPNTFVLSDAFFQAVKDDKLRQQLASMTVAERRAAMRTGALAPKPQRKYVAKPKGAR